MASLCTPPRLRPCVSFPGSCRFTDTVDITADLLAILLQIGPHLLALLLQGHILLLGRDSRRDGSEQHYQR